LRSLAMSVQLRQLDDKDSIIKFSSEGALHEFWS
jgi:hypothetical protein